MQVCYEGVDKYYGASRGVNFEPTGDVRQFSVASFAVPASPSQAEAQSHGMNHKVNPRSS